MRLLILLFTLAALLSGQGFYQNPYCLSSTATGSDGVTLQQGSSQTSTKALDRVWVQCAAGCNVVLRRNGANPTTTAATILKGGASLPASTGLGYTATNVGDGDYITGFAVPTTGGVEFDLSGFFVQGADGGSTYAVTGTEFTSVAVATNVGTVTLAAHGLSVGDSVTIRGATTDADLNASYTVASVPSADTFTIATSSVSDGTYNETSDAGMSIGTEGENFSIIHDAASGASLILFCWKE